MKVSISVDEEVLKMNVLHNRVYRISEEYHNNDVGSWSKYTLCYAQGAKLESNGENWLKYAVIRYTINIHTTLIDNL